MDSNTGFYIPSALEEVVKEIESIGGNSYLVGGAVIDMLQKREMKDWDIEVYNLSFQQLQDLLSNYGSPDLVGKSFGIIKLRIDDTEYDFNLPRKESKIGVGHKDFDIELTPTISPEEAAQRRDITINSMFINLATGELVDHYNGQADLEEGVIRHTAEGFVEDPLRVLRIMQLLPRKGRYVAPETTELCKGLVKEYLTISKERVFEEWRKLLIRADKPSLGLNFLVDCRWLAWFPELDVLRTTEQNPDWHPEGDVWYHTKMVVDNAAYVRPQIDPDWQLSFMFGALLHDVGKAVTTTEDLRSPNHAIEGVPIAKQFMKRITDETSLTERVLKIVECHMRPGDLTRADSKESAWKRLHNTLRLDIAGYISKCDFAGREGEEYSMDAPHPPSEKAFELFEGYGKEKIPPVLMGRDLVALGHKPGPEIGRILREAYELQIQEGISDKADLLKILNLDKAQT